MYVLFSPKGEQLDLGRLFKIDCNLRNRYCRNSAWTLTYLMLILLKEPVIKSCISSSMFWVPLFFAKCIENLQLGLYL